MNFTQLPDDTLSQAWTRFHELLTTGPDLGIDNHVIMQTFYMSLSERLAEYLDASAGGSFLELKPSKSKEVLERIAGVQSMRSTWVESDDEDDAEGYLQRSQSFSS